MSYPTNSNVKRARSTVLLIAASLLLPPVGLVLLWKRKDLRRMPKIAGTLWIILLCGGYLYLLNVWHSRQLSEAKYTALEEHRARQQREALQSQASAAQSTVVSPSPSPSAPGSTGNNTQMEPRSESATAHASRNYWTNFRGPNRDGRYEEMPVLATWPTSGIPFLWKQPIGEGFSSFVAADGRAYTIEQRREQEVCTAYEITTGRELWKQGWNAHFSDSTGDGPRATPTWDDGRLYVLGATGEFRCLDAQSGRVIWGKNILSDNQAENLPWAMAASPLIVDDKVIVLPGGTANKSVAAYNKTTGATVWKALSDRQAYVSPMLVTLNGRRQILVVSASRIIGLNPQDGKILWSYPWETEMGINVSQPLIVNQSRFFISSGYGKGAALIEVSGSGDSLAARAVWQNGNMKNKFNSSVLYEGYVYGLDEGILTCIDVNTGERKWKGGRYGYGQVLVAGGNLIVLSDAGELVLIKATSEGHNELGRFVALEGKTWNYPAIAGGRLLVRNANEMAAYNIAAQ